MERSEASSIPKGCRCRREAAKDSTGLPLPAAPEIVFTTASARPNVDRAEITGKASAATSRAGAITGFSVERVCDGRSWAASAGTIGLPEPMAGDAGCNSATPFASPGASSAAVELATGAPNHSAIDGYNGRDAARACSAATPAAGGASSGVSLAGSPSAGAITATGRFIRVLAWNHAIFKRAYASAGGAAAAGHVAGIACTLNRNREPDAAPGGIHAPFTIAALGSKDGSVRRQLNTGGGRTMDGIAVFRKYVPRRGGSGKLQVRRI